MFKEEKLLGFKKNSTKSLIIKLNVSNTIIKKAFLISQMRKLPS